MSSVHAFNTEYTLLPFDEFQAEVIFQARNYLDNIDRHDIELKVQECTRSTGPVNYLIVVNENGINPSINLDTFYQEYVTKGSELLKADNPVEMTDFFQSINDKIASVIDQALENVKGMDFSPEDLANYEIMKSHLLIQLVNKEKNKDFLETVPHTDYADLAAVYRVKVDIPSSRDENTELASFVIHNDYLSRAGITIDQLHADAIDSLSQNAPVQLTNIQQMIADMYGMDVSELENESTIPCIVVRNEYQSYGASAVLQPEFADKLKDYFGNQDVFLLPSSIHEMLAIPATTDQNELRGYINMVQAVNSENVAPAEQLSGNVYHYVPETRSIELATDYINRQRMISREIDKMAQGSDIDTQSHIVSFNRDAAR